MSSDEDDVTEVMHKHGVELTQEEASEEAASELTHVVLCEVLSSFMGVTCCAQMVVDTLNCSGSDETPNSLGGMLVEHLLEALEKD